MIIGHHRQLQYLKRVLTKGTLAHAYLFHGPEAVGKKTAALAVAKSLLCRNNNEVRLGGCGQCGDCRQVEGLTHPDLVFLSSEHLLIEDENKREIGIKNIHELQRILGLSAWSGGWRIAVIDRAEHLSREAQSALLKILEEPSSRTAFFLITGNTEALLPTIRSRCVEMSFGTVAGDEMAACLNGIPASRHSSLLALAQGQPGVLIRLMGDKTFFDEFRAGRDAFEKLLRMNLSGQFLFSEKEAREPRVLESFLEFLLQKFYQARPNFAEQNSGGAKRRAAVLKMLLEKLAISRSIAANRRLLADNVFFELQMLEANPPKFLPL